jgi:hypothetical protein
VRGHNNVEEERWYRGRRLKAKHITLPAESVRHLSFLVKVVFNNCEVLINFRVTLAQCLTPNQSL